jgi:transposase InsO family protein
MSTRLIFKKLLRVYQNPKDSGALGGVERLFQRARNLGITKNKQVVKDFLASQRSYTFHKQARKHFTRNKTFVSGIDSQWQADLADMQSLSKENDGVKYLLTVIDVFSKFAWIVPIKDKTSKEMVSAFRTLFSQSKPRKPKKLQTDKGLEFLNKEVQNVLKREYDVSHFTTMGETKASVVERFNRTIKERIWRYFTQTNDKRYVDVLADLVSTYNNSVHRSIKMSPIAVTKADEPKIWRRLFGNGAHATQPPKFTTGDTVRITKYKGDFAKGYEPNWTEEEFVVKTSKNSQLPEMVYKIEDADGEPILGTFYTKQLQKIQKSQEYRVERIIQKRTDPKTKVKQVLVKWEGWPEKFNTWIPETNIKNG